MSRYYAVKYYDEFNGAVVFESFALAKDFEAAALLFDFLGYEYIDILQEHKTSK